MSTSTHAVAPEEVMAFLDGELSADRTEFMSAHVQECGECRQTAEALGHSSSALAKWTVPAAPVCFEEGVLHRSNRIQTLSAGERISDFRRFLYRRPRLAWGGAVVAALLIFFSEGDGSYLRHRLNSARAPRMALPRPESAQDVVLGNAANGPRGGDQLSRAPGVPITRAGRVADSNGLLQVIDGEKAVSVEHQQITARSVLAPASPLIARTVSLSLVVKDFEGGRASLDAILARYHGYAASLNVSSPQGAARVIQASLRIPAPQLPAALGELKSLGRVEGETQNGQEVTEQHADLVARIKNDRETELRLQDILRTRTGKVKDVLDVEQEIARVRGEIEQMEAEQKTLEHRVDFAAIDLKLAEEYKAQLNTPAPSVLIELRNASINGFRNAFESLLALVLFLAESGPSLLLWLALAGIPAWRLWRRYRRAHSLAGA